MVTVLTFIKFIYYNRSYMSKLLVYKGCNEPSKEQDEMHIF